MSDSLRDKLRPTVLTVDLDAIISNLRLLKDYTGGRSQLAVVKANAYGMGAVPVARALIKGGAAWLGVALAEEGAQLRRAGLSVPILMLGPAAPSQAALLLRENITPAVYSIEFSQSAGARSGAARHDLRGPPEDRFGHGTGRIPPRGDSRRSHGAGSIAPRPDHRPLLKPGQRRRSGLFADRRTAGALP